MDEHQAAQDELSATTAALRREILRNYPAGERRDGYVAQIDELERRGIHRIERHPVQSPHYAVGDALDREARKDREAAKESGIEAAREEVRRERRRESGAGTDLDRGAARAPEPSDSGWAKAYQVERDGAAVVYRRDEQEQIRDDGRTVTVAHDERSIRDAVTLLKEQGSGRIAVRATDPEKRAAIMRECVRQNQRVQMPSKAVEAEYHRACVAVAREEALAHRAHEQKTTREHAKPGVEMGD